MDKFLTLHYHISWSFSLPSPLTAHLSARELFTTIYKTSQILSKKKKTVRSPFPEQFFRITKGSLSKIKDILKYTRKHNNLYFFFINLIYLKASISLSWVESAFLLDLSYRPVSHFRVSLIINTTVTSYVHSIDVWLLYNFIFLTRFSSKPSLSDLCQVYYMFIHDVYLEQIKQNKRFLPYTKTTPISYHYIQ